MPDLTPHQFSAERTKGQQRLLDADHLGIKRFLRLDAAAYEDATADGGLDAPTKELLGLVASAVLRCDDCIRYHIEQCIRLGLTKKQVEDAMHVALVVGGSIVVPHARRALLYLDAFAEQQAYRREP
ncbi:MAG: carboxymuconolactone decarboxylase family protein [Phycisphaeraceae bacterium]|nr:MAG: carboxymuconolactone decarboxylase family protein [Phycisphaeraceae bacterium]